MALGSKQSLTEIVSFALSCAIGVEFECCVCVVSVTCVMYGIVYLLVLLEFVNEQQ